MLKMYAYQNCDTCRRALKYLKEQGLPYQVLPIREQPPTKSELKRMLHCYEGEVRKLFNTSGQDYKKLNLKDRLPALSEDEALELLAANGNLVKRPFLVGDGVGLVGFRHDEWARVLSQG